MTRIDEAENTCMEYTPKKHYHPLATAPYQDHMMPVRSGQQKPSQKVKSSGQIEPKQIVQMGKHRRSQSVRDPLFILSMQKLKPKDDSIMASTLFNCCSGDQKAIEDEQLTEKLCHVQPSST